MTTDFFFPFNRKIAMQILGVLEISAAGILLGMFLMTRASAQGSEYQRVEAAQLRERVAKAEVTIQADSLGLSTVITRLEKVEKDLATMSGMGIAVSGILGAISAGHLIISLKK